MCDIPFPSSEIAYRFAVEEYGMHISDADKVMLTLLSDDLSSKNSFAFLAALWLEHIRDKHHFPLGLDSRPLLDKHFGF